MLDIRQEMSPFRFSANLSNIQPFKKNSRYMDLGKNIVVILSSFINVVAFLFIFIFHRNFLKTFY